MRNSTALEVDVDRSNSWKSNKFRDNEAPCAESEFTPSNTLNAGKCTIFLKIKICGFLDSRDLDADSELFFLVFSCHAELSNRFRSKLVQVLSTLARADADSRDVVNRRATNNTKFSRCSTLLLARSVAEEKSDEGLNSLASPVRF